MEKIDWKVDGKYQTKDGRKVKYIGRSSHPELPIVVECENEHQEDHDLAQLREDGGYWATCSDLVNDVIEVPPELKVYVYALLEGWGYKGSIYGGLSLVAVFSSSEDAQAAAINHEDGDRVYVLKMEMNSLENGEVAFSKKKDGY
jgi:hypothetical protein